MSSPLSNSTFTLGTENRSKLYYNKFQYRAKMQLTSVHLTHYSRSYDELANVINKQRYFIATYDVITVGSDTFNLLVQWINWKNANKDAVTVRIESNSCSVFSNDLQLLQTLTTISDNIQFTESLVTEDPNVITLVNPKHNFRVYFKGILPTTGLYEELETFFKTHKKSLFPCKSLTKQIAYNLLPTKLRGQWYWTRCLNSSHFVEYDDESRYTLLKLYLPNILAKNYKVVKR